MKKIHDLLLYTFAVSKTLILHPLSIIVSKIIFQIKVQKHAPTLIFVKKILEEKKFSIFIGDFS